VTLRVRVALLVAAVVTVVVAAVGWTAVRSARAELTEEVDQDLLQRAALVFAQPRGDFWAGSLARRPTGIGSLLRADPLGSLVSLDAYARVVLTDLDPGADGVIRGQVIVALDDDIGTVPDTERLERARRRGPVVDTVTAHGVSLRLMTVRAADGVFVQVARPLDEVENAVEDLRRQVLLFGLLAVTVAAAGAWFLAGRAVRPIVRLTDTAEKIAETGDVDLPVESPEAGEVGRLAAIGLLLLAAFHWVAAFFGWYSMLQVARIAFLLLAVAGLLAPNFAGVAAQRRRLVGAWLFVVLLVFYGATVINAPSTIETPTDMFIGGFSVTLLVSVLTIMLSFPIGVLLALARTSRQPIFRVLSTVYIEVIRGVPLITLLLFFSGVLPLFLPDGMEIAELAAAILGYTLFSAAYLAENVRGGLQSIRRGQYEAADAVGLTTTQRTGFIVLPQSLRVSIPPLVGQVIATFKETSLLAIIGLFDFLRMANSVVPNQSQFLGVRREGLLFISVVYWVVAFAMSKYSQRLEQRVGLGQR